ncbi:MAG: hypothetical protein EXS13_01025 [Planctomycetes bacterium]|nr:hypothetical protein [Planctomycetota bacterium]
MAPSRLWVGDYCRRVVAPRRLLQFTLLAIVAWSGLPSLAGGFRSEDWLALEAYSRMDLLDVWSHPHLDMRLFGYWRPLSDSVTWLLAHTLEPWPAAVQLALAMLHLAAAGLVGVAGRRLLGLSAGAAFAASLVAAAHPWSSAVVTYLDGGTSTLIVALCTLLALVALGRWRDGVGGAAPLCLATLLAGLAYDAAIVLPIVIVVVARVLPRSERAPERGVPWPVVAVFPLLLLLRWCAVGMAFDGYPLTSEALLEFPRRLVLCTGRLFVPFFAEHGSPRAAMSLALAAIGLLALIVAVAARSGIPPAARVAASVALRQGGALLLLSVGLLGYAPDLFVGGRGAVPDELVQAYKSYPAALAAALAVGWWLGFANGPHDRASLVLALPVVALFVVYGSPIRDEHARAQQWSTDIVAAVAARADAQPAGAPDRYLVVEVPTKVQRSGRSGTRCLQFGLPNALRPPLHDPECFAYPLFQRELDGFAAWVSAPAFDALAASRWLEPLTCRYPIVDGRERVVVEALPRPSPPLAAIELLADLDGVAPAPFDLADAPLVEVAADSSIVLAAYGVVPAGSPRFFFLNRVHPCVSDRIELVTELPGRAPPPAGVQRARIGTPWLREIAHRFPDDVVFVVLELLATPELRAQGAPEAVVSNVLAIRLRTAR